jgi:NAD(P)-dependent dehydrogenase (short-subunit alcohol dehydrogenase family)
MAKRRLRAPTGYIVLDARKTMEPKRSDSSRRGFFGGLSAGLFTGHGAAALSPQPGTSSSSRASNAAASAVKPMFDYARSPFPRRQQQWPRSAVGSQPRPDHGETRSRGSGRLVGRKALVTGGDSGIGRAAAIAFAREGADVAFNYLLREQSEADEIAQLIRQAGRKAIPLPGDLRDEDFCNQLVADAVRELGGLDILVSNVTRQQAATDIAEMSTEQFDATFKTNIYAMFWLTKAALPHMGPGSSIINTSSISTCDPSDILLDYSVTKGVIMVFTKSLAKQLASRGIRVNAVAPGPIWTPLPSSDDPPSDQRPATGTDDATAASTYVLLASNESSYATGQLYGAVGGNGAP